MSKCSLVSFALLALLVGNIVYYSVEESLSMPINYAAKQVEVVTKGKLLDDQGRLIESGFSRHPLKEINEENIPSFLGRQELAFLRYKKWDFFSVVAEEFILLAHIADLGYAGNVQLVLYHYKSNEVVVISEVVHNVSTLPKLSPNSYNYDSNYSYASSDLKLEIQQSVKGKKQIVNLKFQSDRVSGAVTMEKLSSEEELVMMSKMSESGDKFFYNTKAYGLRVSGDVSLKTITGTANTTEKFSGLNWQGGRDIGRGVWNYSSFWFWAHAQGFVVDPTTGGKLSFGLDMGNGFEHGSSETYEDSVLLSGRLHKLKVVRRSITYNAWTFSTDGN